jgi:hypothetical protein
MTGGCDALSKLLIDRTASRLIPKLILVLSRQHDL